MIQSTRSDATHHNLSKYNRIYENYEDHIVKQNTTKQDCSDKVHIIMKQYIAPKHMILCNFCMLSKWVHPIISSMRSHRESFGSSSHLIIHSFGTAGTVILCAMNEIIKDSKDKLYYDGIIYDSPHLGPLSVYSILHSISRILNGYILYFVCFDNIWCSLSYYFVYALFVIVAVCIFPIIWLLFALYILITCSMDYVWCHDKQLMCLDNVRILSVPILIRVFGSYLT